jgi:hypothetical protein
MCTYLHARGRRPRSASLAPCMAIGWRGHNGQPTGCRRTVPGARSAARERSLPPAATAALVRLRACEAAGRNHAERGRRRSGQTRGGSQSCRLHLKGVELLEHRGARVLGHKATAGRHGHHRRREGVPCIAQTVEVVERDVDGISSPRALAVGVVRVAVSYRARRLLTIRPDPLHGFLGQGYLRSIPGLDMLHLDAPRVAIEEPASDQERVVSPHHRCPPSAGCYLRVIMCRG